MGFVGVVRAIYDFQPTGENELAIQEGDLLLVLDKSSGDDWWRAKKKAQDDDDDEPEGLIPNNYVEEAGSALIIMAQALSQAKALYDYSRQTDEELSFTEDVSLQVYDTSDPEWSLVGLQDEYGFAPANYIEILDQAPTKPARPRPAQDVAPEPEEDVQQQHARDPATDLASILRQKTGSSTAGTPRTVHAADEDEPAPSLPRRPRSEVKSSDSGGYASPQSPETPGIIASPSTDRRTSGHGEPPPSGGYHLYNIHEMISHMGKNKKMPTTLGINLARGVIMIAPEKSRDGPQKEWTAEKLTHYSIEGKHVFMELVRPSKSIDFHAGAKDTAVEIVGALGELAGAVRAGGAREVLDAASGQGGQKRGHMLFEFMAQQDDEVSVAEGDEVIVLDDSKSAEWWMVKRLKNGKEGVVPSNFIEVTGIIEAPSDPGLASAKSIVEQNRLDEEREAREAVKGDKRSKASKRESQATAASADSRPRPNPSKVREWTDRTGSFHVRAEFLGLKDNKMHLHKEDNGVQIAVLVSKMSLADLEYVERVTGQSLDDDKPLSDIKRRSTQRRSNQSPRPNVGVAVEPQTPKYDWFDFFLQCGVNPQICERYTAAFDKDQMGEENMQDIQPTLLRTLGLKEGDILRVMKFLDQKYGRTSSTGQQDGANGGIFSGSNGALKNNRKGRPAPALSNNDTVDPRAFEQNGIREDKPAESIPIRKSSAAATPAARSGNTGQKNEGFEDDAWNVKPDSRLRTDPVVSSPPSNQNIVAPLPQKPTQSGAADDLSLLALPLQPSQTPDTPASKVQPPSQPTPSSQIQGHQVPPQQLRSQPTGADRSFFDQLGHPQNPSQQPLQQQQTAMPRQRPQPPMQPQGQASFLPPPPGRSSSAPQNQHPSAFGPPPLQPQMTGYQQQIAPPGQSLNDLTRQQYQQQHQQQASQQPPPTQQQANGFGYNNQQPQPPSNQYAPTQQPQPTGFYPTPMSQQFPTQSQPGFLTAQQTGSPFADPPRPPFQPMQPQRTNFQPQPYSNAPQQYPQQTGISPRPGPVNNYLPPPLQPQPTGFNGIAPQPTGNFGGQPPGFNQQPPPMLHQQPAPTPAPLQPQKTGPAPPVRFGAPSANKLTPQPTGRANLANATPQNPFGF